jgi:hypothetical protein
MDSSRHCTTPKVCGSYCDAWNNPDNPENQGDSDDEGGEGSGEEGEGSAAGSDAASDEDAEAEVANSDDGNNDAAVAGDGDGELEDIEMPDVLNTDGESEDDEDGDDDDDMDSIFDALDNEAPAEEKEGEEKDRAPPSDGDVEANDWYDSEDEANQLWFEATHKVIQPEPLAEYKFVGYPFTKAPWADKNLQVIVKLANIHLTPEKPSYPGGSWHIEGQLNERIVATALYYYDNENITDSHLAFRTACNAESLCENFGYAQSDHAPFATIFGANPGLDEHSTVLEFGKVLTREGRLLVFPNVMQHRVGDFRLADPTKPGHRKIVALFLVDPETPVISTANVPPQQMHWGASVPRVVESRLPPEVAEMVYSHVQCPFKLDEAKKLREELMDERRAIDKHANKAFNYGDFSFCEH